MSALDDLKKTSKELNGTEAQHDNAPLLTDPFYSQCSINSKHARQSPSPTSQEQAQADYLKSQNQPREYA
jgi:hypothetical protein